MKIKKDSVKCKIIDSATKEFYKNGYKDASMRDIAGAAGITPGNIYRYFPSKEALFETVVDSIYSWAIRVLAMNFDFTKINPNERKLAFIAENVTNYVIKNKLAFLILLTKANGSKFETVVADFKEKIAKAINDTKTESDIDVCNVYAEALVHSIIYITETYFNDEKKLKDLSFKLIFEMFKSSKEF